MIGNTWNRWALSTRHHALRHRHLTSVSDAILNRAVHQIGFSWIVGICIPSDMHLLDIQRGSDLGSRICCGASSDSFLVIFICFPLQRNLVERSKILGEDSTLVTIVGTCAMLTDFCLKWPQRLEPRSGMLCCIFGLGFPFSP